MKVRLSRYFVLAVLLFAGFTQVSAGGAEPAHARFLGQFIGRGLSATADLPSAAPLRVRDMDVTIRAAGEGFVITWTTVLSHRNGGEAPHLQRRTATYAFVPDVRPGWYRSVEPAAPLEGQPLVWARIEGKALVVTIYTVLEDGHSDLQIYSRQVTGDRMELSYIRTHENVATAAVRGWLSRIGD